MTVLNFEFMRFFFFFLEETIVTTTKGNSDVTSVDSERLVFKSVKLHKCLGHSKDNYN